MGLPLGIWLIFIGLLWGAEAVLPGSRGDSLQLGNPRNHAIGMAGNSPSDDDDILRINQGLIPPEAPESSFLLEGDIIKESPSRVFSSASPKWPKRRGTVQIPYVISYKYDKLSVKVIKEAFADFAKFTCIKFVPYSYQRDFISVTPMAGCFSSVGRTGGMQVVSLAPACLRRGKGVALHELMHVVGFWHEHSRADRDKYISISWNQILTGFEINFMKSWTSNMLVNYDYSSVMHYGRYAFSMTGLPTITPLSDPYTALGQRWNLSRSDIARVNKLYKCSLTGAGAGSPTKSTIKENVTNSISNELEPCPTEGEIKVSTPSPTAKASSPATDTLETVQSARGPSTQMSAPTARTEKFLGRTAMHDEGLSGLLTPGQGVESVKFAPTGLSTPGMTHLEASGKTPPTYVEMSTLEAEGKLLIPMEETSLLGTVSIQEPHFTTVTLSPESQTSPKGVTLHHGKLAEGLGTTRIPSETLAGLEFPEWVSPTGVAPVAKGVTRPREVGIVETMGIQGMELAYHSTSLAQTGPSPAAEVGVPMTLNETWVLETQTELSTAEITSSSEESSGTSMLVVHTAATLGLGQTPPTQVSATETSHPTSTKKWTANLPRLTSAKSRSTPTGWIPSVEMEMTTVAYAREQTSLLPTTQSWISSPTKQRNQSVAHQAYTPGHEEQSTTAIPASGIKETELTVMKQPTSLTTSSDIAENHTTYLIEIGVQGATMRHNKSTALSSSKIETIYIEPPTKATTFMEMYSELGFVETTRIKASSHVGFPSLTEETYLSVTKVKDAEYATEAETLPLTGVSQASEPAELGMPITTANYRNKERTHTSALFPLGGPSPTAIGPTYTIPPLGASQNPHNEGPAEATRNEDRSQANLPTRNSTEMGVQEARNASPNRRRGHTYTPASLSISSTATELEFMEHPTSEELGLETAVAQASSPSEMRIGGVSSAWTEAKDQFPSSTKEAAVFPVSSATEKGNSTKVIQSLESASLSEMGTKEHRVHYRVAGLVTLTLPESRPRTAWGQSKEIPELTVPGKLTPVHTEPTTNQTQTGVKNTSLALMGKMPFLQTESTKATYPTEEPLLLQASPQTFNPIELRLKTSRKQQTHAAIASRDNLTPTASLSAGELLQHSAKDVSTQASEIPTMRSEEAKGRTFPVGTTVQKTYMKLSAMGVSESQTNASELQTPEALLAHAGDASFPKVLPSEAETAPPVGSSEVRTIHSILTWEPIDGPRQQTMAQFPKASTLRTEHVTEGMSLEAPAVSKHVETLGMEAKEHSSLLERTFPPLSQAPEVTFAPETLATSSPAMGVWEAIIHPTQRSRGVSHPAHSIEGISLETTEPTYRTAFVGPQHPTVSPGYPDTAKAMGTEAGNQLSLSILDSRTEMGDQEFKGEPKKKGRQNPTLPSGGKRESLTVEPSLKSSPREGGRGETTATETHLSPSSQAASTPGSHETQTIGTPKSTVTGVPASPKRAFPRREQTASNSPVRDVMHGPFLEAQTKTVPQALVGLQKAKSHGTRGRALTLIAGTKVTYIKPSPETAVAPGTNPCAGTANTTGVDASEDTACALNTSMERNVQEAVSNCGKKEGVHTYTTGPVGTWPVLSKSEHLGHPPEGTHVQEAHSISPHGKGATKTASTGTTAPNASNTTEGTSVAKTATEALHSPKVTTPLLLLLEVPENKTFKPRGVAMKEETSSYRVKEDLVTTHLVPSVTWSTETTEQVQPTQEGELMLPENWPSGLPELGIGKRTTQTGEHTSLVSMGELPSLGAEPTTPVHPAESTSLLQASPHQTFSPIEQKITTTTSRETHSMILPWEKYDQSPMSSKGVQPAETKASGLVGISTEIPTWRLEGVSAFHRKKGQGKSSLLATGTTLPAENESLRLSSTKVARGMEAFQGQATSQTELEITKVSLAQLLGSLTPAERTSFPGAEATELAREVPSGGTGTQITLPNETREKIPTARTQLVGNEATEQSYSTIMMATMKASETPSSPSERMLYTTTSGRGKKNGGQANTHPPVESMSSAGSDTTHSSHSLWPPNYQTTVASTKPLVSGSLSAGGGIPAGEMEPTPGGSSLKTQTTSSVAEGNEEKSNLSAYGGVTPVDHWGLKNKTYAPEWNSDLSEEWTINTTKLTNGDAARSEGERTAFHSAVGGMPTPGTKTHSIKVIQLKRPYRKHPGALVTVDPEILRLVGKRSLLDEVRSPAPLHDSKPDLKAITPSHRQTGPELQSPLLSNPLETQRAKVLRGVQKQNFLVPGFQVSPVTALYPAAKEFKSVPGWLVTGTSECAPGHRCGLFRPKELSFLGGKMATNLAPVLTLAKTVRAIAPPGMDKPISATLPRQHSGPGEQGHRTHIPQATVVSRLPEWQLCDFEGDLCGWQHSETDDFDWILAGERPARSPPSGRISGLQNSPSGGNYISLRSPSTRQTPGQKTALVSPVLHGIGCVHFWYSPLGSVMGTINIYIKFADAPEWHRIWTAKGQQGTEWHQVGVEASESRKLQVIVEGVIGPEAGADAGIDDLSVCGAECQGGCKELITLYKKQDVQQTK